VGRDARGRLTGAAFALPIVLANRQPFPGRSYILFLTFCVILTTLFSKA
jgi:NhaP-type Na+/H+ or K+/H+ antiporter